MVIWLKNLETDELPDAVITWDIHNDYTALISHHDAL